jgi:hypothetical protein
MDEPTAFKGLESLTDYTIRLVGSGIEIFGVLIISAGRCRHRKDLRA